MKISHAFFRTPQATSSRDAALRSSVRPDSVARQFDFWDGRYEGRRLFAEVLGTFFLVLVAAGAGMVNARFGGDAVPAAARVVAPGLMVMAVILFMGTVSGAHLNPAVSVAFALRGNFPWRRVPAYIVAQFAGSLLAVLLLRALIGGHGRAGLTLPGPAVSPWVALAWETVLTAGLVSVILGTASGAQQIGPLAAIGVGGYIALAGLWGAPVSGASMAAGRPLRGQRAYRRVTSGRVAARSAPAHGARRGSSAVRGPVRHTKSVTDDSAAPLITAKELAAGLANGRPPVPPVPPVLLDVRWRLGGPPGRELYQAGHLPGAVFVDLDRDLAAAPGSGGRHPLPAAADFEAAMRRAGVRGDRPVVVYDDADATAAARAWWLLRYFGHPSVRVLDGGFAAWTAAGQPVESGAPDTAGTVPPGDFTAEPGHLALLDAEGAAALAGSGLLLDARAGARYRGETEPVDPVAGHIPGAVSAPTAENVNPDGTFLPPAELAARFAALGATDGTDVGVYCGSGVTAAHEALALALAGLPAAVYVGSWSNWVADPARPVATGAEPGTPA